MLILPIETKNESLSNWLEVAFASEDFTEIITLNRNVISPERTVMVDTNYLIQLKKDDFESILLNPNYQVSAKSVLSRQMALLFKDLLEQKIDMCLSNFIMREFIGVVPKKRDLLDLYRRHIAVVSPNENYEANFMDLSSAINSCMNQAGFGIGDVKDTYSYILAVLAKARFFVTEDKDLKRVYEYLSAINEKNSEEKSKEISKIKEVYDSLSDKKSEFPVEKILNYLFCMVTISEDRLTVPISICNLSSHLPQALDKFSNILWIMRTTNEIDWLSKRVSKLPDKWNFTILETAKKRILEIAKAVGLQENELSNEYKFKAKIIEQEKEWLTEPSDIDLSYDLSTQLTILHTEFYSEEVDEIEYDNLEDYYSTERNTKEFEAKCQNCAFEFELIASYIGVTCSEEREMGPERYHEWCAIEICPKCGSEISIQHTIYEYPFFVENADETNCEGCDLLPEKTPEKPPSTTLKSFM